MEGKKDACHRDMKTQAWKSHSARYNEVKCHRCLPFNSPGSYLTQTLPWLHLIQFQYCQLYGASARLLLAAVWIQVLIIWAIVILSIITDCAWWFAVMIIRGICLMRPQRRGNPTGPTLHPVITNQAPAVQTGSIFNVKSRCIVLIWDQNYCPWWMMPCRAALWIYGSRPAARNIEKWQISI